MRKLKTGRSFDGEGILTSVTHGGGDRFYNRATKEVNALSMQNSSFLFDFYINSRIIARHIQIFLRWITFRRNTLSFHPR